MPSNLPFLFRSVVDLVRRNRGSRVAEVATHAVSSLGSVKDFVVRKFRRDGKGPMTPAEVAKIYSQLPDKEKQAITEAVKVAASESPTTLEGISPTGKNLTHRAVGTLLFEDKGPNGEPRPLHNVLVELWDRDFGFDDILGRGMTDQDGNFEIWYDPDDAGKWESPDLELRVFETNHVYKKGQVQLNQRLVFTIKGDDNVTITNYDFGLFHVPYWEYDEQKKLPRLLIVDYSAPPQSFSPGRALVMNQQLKWLLLIREKHVRLNQLNPHQPSLEEIQKDYPETKTILIDREHDCDYSRSDEYFADRLLNGIAAAVLDKDPDDPSRRWIHYHWNSYEQNGIYAAPNVDIFLRREGNQWLPVEIRLQFREAGRREANATVGKPEVFTPDGDPEKWRQAKRVARVSSVLHAQLDVHLAQTHLNIEQYAVAARRNLRLSPLRQLLLPHVKEVVIVNHEADTRLLGKTGFITRAQALTADALQERLEQVVGTLDWKNWKPRPDYRGNHVFGRAAAAVWDAITEYVDNFFVDHREELVEHWYEAHRFARDLVEHSAKYFLCWDLRRRLLDDQGRFRDGEDTSWYERNERMDLSLERPVVNGEKKAVSLVTDTDMPGGEDLEQMKQLCRYVIYQATFHHYWANSHQLDDGGELRYSGLGLRYNEQGSVMAPEDDPSIAPAPDVASEQLWFAHVLTGTRFGFIMTNEDRDIDPRLIEALRAKKALFTSLGLDIYDIPSRPNI